MAGEEVKTVVVKIFPDLKRRQLIVDLRDFAFTTSLKSMAELGDMAGTPA